MFRSNGSRALGFSRSNRTQIERASLRRSTLRRLRMLERLEDRTLLATAPTIVSVTTSLSGGTLPFGTTSIQVVFSEAVVGGGTASNYMLQGAGADGIIGDADDPMTSLSVAYSGTTATLSFSALPPEVYRLTVSDSITDGSGHALDGQNIGSPSNFTSDFVGQPDPVASLTSPNGFTVNPVIGGFGAGQLVQASNNAFVGLNRLQVGGTDYTPTIPTT